MTKKTILITILIFALGMSTVYAVAVSPYGQMFGFNLVKININQQEAQLRAIDVNGQIYVPIQLYLQEMNQGSYTYDLNSFTVNITRGNGSGAPTGTGTTTNGGNDNYNPYDPYGYYTGGNTGSPTTPYQPPVPYDPYQSDSGYQSEQSRFYDPRFDYKVLYDIVPNRDKSERYHIGFIREDLESLEVFIEEIENMHDELDAVFASTIDRYNKDMTLAEAEKRFDIRMNTYEILEDRLKDLLDEVEDLEKNRQVYESQLDNAIDELDDAIKEQKNALKYLSRYIDNKRSSYRDKFDDYQDQTMSRLNDTLDYLDEAVDGIEDALSEFER